MRGKIQKKYDLNLYSRLAQLCLAQVLLFNRRRSGEAERIKLQKFLDADKESGKPDQVVLSTLNECEKTLCSTHTRVKIKESEEGKLCC